MSKIVYKKTIKTIHNNTARALETIIFHEFRTAWHIRHLKGSGTRMRTNTEKALNED